MQIMPMIMSMQATSLAHDSANLMFGAHVGIANLANSVTGNESPADIARIAQMEKAMALKGIQAQTNLQVAWAMQETAANLRKKNQELNDRLRSAGATFV